MTTTRTSALLVAGVASLAILAAPTAASACGGLFCSVVNLQPVQQNAERILFEVNGDGTITSIVEIRFNGEADDFSWVVPIPDTPSLDVVPTDVLLLLDDATRPTIISPPVECTSSPSPPVMFGARSESTLAMDGAGGVDVDDLPQVGPYDPTVVSSEDPDALVEWLNDNGYLITPEMEPFVAQYVADGMKFLAMKLAPEAETTDITPILMTYAGDQPTVPIVLTSVAAEPEMGVMVFIAAEQRYGSANFTNIEIDPEDVSMNPRTQQNNYYPLVSWKADQAGGNAAFTQYVEDIAVPIEASVNLWGWNAQYEDSYAWLDGLQQRHSTISRLYTRLSGWEMETDPSFEPDDGGAVSNMIDLSGRPKVEICADAPAVSSRVPCGDNYCGVDAMCATTKDWGEGCVCPAGQTTRIISEPDAVTLALKTTVVCEQPEFDMMASLASMDLDNPLASDPCANDSCGSDGECVAVNGFATCSCDDGYAGVAGLAGPYCAEVQQTYGADALVWTAGCGCETTGDAGSKATLAILILPLAMIVRRRRDAA